MCVCVLIKLLHVPNTVVGICSVGGSFLLPETLGIILKPILFQIQESANKNVICPVIDKCWRIHVLLSLQYIWPSVFFFWDLADGIYIIYVFVLLITVHDFITTFSRLALLSVTWATKWDTSLFGLLEADFLYLSVLESYWYELQKEKHSFIYKDPCEMGYALCEALYKAKTIASLRKVKNEEVRESHDCTSRLNITVRGGMEVFWPGCYLCMLSYSIQLRSQKRKDVQDCWK